jgi:PTS system sucrose-specific IIC component
MEPVPLLKIKGVDMDYKKAALDAIAAAGGKENISHVEHCATRLRIETIDKEKVDLSGANDIEGAKGAFLNNEQLQIVFGTGTVNKVFAAYEGLEEKDSSMEEIKKKAQANKAKNQENPFKRAIKTFGDVFVPIIPVLVATGLFMGLRGLITQPEVLATFGKTPADISENFIMWTQILTDTAFAFLPALVAWSAFRVFGGSPVIGIVLGLMLVHPSLPNAYQVASGDASPIIMFGFIPVVGYQGTVLPAFISGLLGAKLEKSLRKVIPDSLDLLLTPFLVLAIMSTLSLFAIGPVFHSLEVVVLNATKWILGLPFGIAGILIGGLQQLIVVTGIHHIFNFLEVQLLADTGKNDFNALLSAATAAQAGAVLAVGVKTKDKKIKQIAYPSALSAALGITEPAIFGINLRFIKPFVMAMIGGAAGGFFASVFKLAGNGMAVTVLPGILLYLDNVLMYLLMLLISGVVAFILTYLFGYSDKMLEE